LLIFPLAVLVTRVGARPTLGRVLSVAVLAVLFVDPGVDWQGMWWSRHHLGGILVTSVMLYATLALTVWLALEKRK
jgi:hypothetical protein